MTDRERSRKVNDIVVGGTLLIIFLVISAAFSGLITWTQVGIGLVLGWGLLMLLLAVGSIAGHIIMHGIYKYTEAKEQQEWKK